MPDKRQERVWSTYRRIGEIEAIPWGHDIDMTNVSVAKVDTPKPGGMICRNPENHQDMWYVAPEYFNKNYTGPYSSTPPSSWTIRASNGTSPAITPEERLAKINEQIQNIEASISLVMHALASAPPEDNTSLGYSG